MWQCAPCAPLLAFPLLRPTSACGGAPARRGQTTRRGGRGPWGWGAPGSRSWSSGDGGWGWRMRTGGGGNRKLGGVRWGRKTWTWDGVGGRGGAWGRRSGGGGGWGWPLHWPGSSPGGEGVVLDCMAVFSAAPSVGVPRSPREGVPSFPCAGPDARSVCASAACLGG